MGTSPRDHTSRPIKWGDVPLRGRCLGWVLLNCYNVRSEDSPVTDAKTAAECRTSTGRLLRVWFDVAPPPASSYLHYHCARTKPKVKPDDFRVIAAHGDYVLIGMMYRRRGSELSMRDHLLYRAGAADAARPPSLSLLPARDIPKKYERGTTNEPYQEPGSRALTIDDAGLLRRGEDDELLVVQLQEEKMAKRHDLLAGPSLPIINVGDRFMCWADCYKGVLICDMDEASPKVRHVPMPLLPPDRDWRSFYSDDLPPLGHSKAIGAAGNNTLRFVRIESRCCCGGHGRSSCSRSRYAFTVTTWTLTLKTDEPMSWVKEGVLDCEEIWALPGYEGLPRMHLRWPVVSLDNPDIICFEVSDHYSIRSEDRKAWMIQVDTRRKELVSAIPFTTDPWKEYLRIPAKFQG
ncbi:hypothetical protein EJB05_29070, partial [Eragrostis curvula]